MKRRKGSFFVSPADHIYCDFSNVLVIFSRNIFILTFQDLQLLDLFGANIHTLNPKVREWMCYWWKYIIYIIYQYININFQVLILAFKKKAFLSLPGKHTGLSYAHSRCIDLDCYIASIYISNSNSKGTKS